ncbi:MAG: zinc ABC transporter substrate-binding protein [Caldilineales bacterium]|nr:zinc ABC transporter substrate-binding protein [Caldilineales bacterium]MDW8317154.1 zinc ABC transporter substrate-binding protein [Anaerolineae bacterium]
MRIGWTLRLIALIAWLVSLAACAPAQSPGGEKLRVVATTSLIGDVVRQVAGDAVDLTVLLPLAVDPHSYQPTPQDAAKIAKAEVVFVNGLGLEGFLDKLIENAGRQAQVVVVSNGIEAMEGHEHEHEGEEHAHEGEGEAHAEKGEQHGSEAEEHDHGGVDPHVWLDPNNVRVWARNIAAALSELDPANAAAYRANAQRYDQTLQALDAWIQEQVAQVPAEQRKLVVDHDSFRYFARRYGFETVGAVIPGFSTLSAPSAQEMAQLEDAIRALGVKAVFVSAASNTALAERVARDTGTQVVFLYTHSLTEPGGAADSYEKMMRYNVEAIVKALKP